MLGSVFVEDSNNIQALVSQATKCGWLSQSMMLNNLWYYKASVVCYLLEA
jgi:hypothetical protein